MSQDHTREPLLRTALYGSAPYDDAPDLQAAITADLGRLATQVGIAMAASEDELAGRYGLTAARARVLETLDNGPVTVAQLARTMGLTRQSVQRSVNRLVRDGFARLGPNPDHARARLARITKTGGSALNHLVEDRSRWLGELARDMAAPNLRIAVGVLRGLHARVEERPAPGQESLSAQPPELPPQG
jgi:DNA-binding MarR family transcriptional regulator